MSEYERSYWDTRYREEGWRTEPATFLLEAAAYLSPGSRILDVAGGTGRNAIWLSQHGHSVTIADISETGLEMARQAAQAAAVEVETVCLDFDLDPLPSGPWDAIVNFQFLNRGLFPKYFDALRPGGLLIVCRATVKNCERHSRPPRSHALEVGEGWALLEGWELLIAREGWSDEDRHDFEALARKP